MTAGADATLASKGLRRGRSRRLVSAAVAVGAAVALLSGCTAGAVLPAPAPALSTTNAPSTPPGAVQSDEQAIRSAIDAVNATAGGSVAGQQAVLAAIVDPALSDAFRHCSPASATLRFEPVYAGLRATPDWTGADGTPAGTLYALPVLIRIYTGDRITGTDLTTLHLGVHDGAASITPLCVG